MRLFLLLLCACHALGEGIKDRPVPPVILVPGDGGSQIEAKLDKPSVVHYVCAKKTDYWFNLWLNIELLVPAFIDCWIDNMRLVYDNATRTTKNSPGVLTRIPGFGNTDTVEWLDPSLHSPTKYFHPIVDNLVTKGLGYKRNVTVRGAPYDFRKAPNEQQEYFAALRKLTEDTYSNVGRRVVFLLHSMGGPMLWYFLSHQPQHWKDKYVEAVISLSGAWGGSVKAVKVYTSGDDLGIFLISPKDIRKEQRASASLPFLLPSADVWKADEMLVETPSKNYSTANFGELLETLQLPDAYNMYLDTKDLLRNLPPPGVELHCLYGVDVETPEKLVYDTDDSFPDTPSVTYGDGDGTVNLRSFQVCESFKGKQKQNVYSKALSGVEHMDVLTDGSSMDYIMELLTNITLRNEKAAAATGASAASTNTIEGNEEVHLNIIQRDNEAAPAPAAAAKTTLRTEEDVHAAAAAAKAARRNEVAVDVTVKESDAVIASVIHLEALEKAREDNLVEKYIVRHLRDDNRIKRSRVSPSVIWKVLSGRPEDL